MKSCIFAALVLCISVSPVAAQPGPAPSQPASEVVPGTSTITPPEHPITREQLQKWMELTMQLDANRTFLQASLDQTRKTLPAWIPDPVWADVKANVAAIDIVGVVLPVYQRYFSQQDGEGMQLMYEGPTGQQYAKLALKSRLDAMNQGLRGSAADARAMQADEAANLDALLRKRMTELTPDELARYHSFDDHANRSLGGDIWRQLDDQQDVLIRTKVNQVFQATMKAHNAELVAAQQAYLAKHPAKQ